MTVSCLWVAIFGQTQDYWYMLPGLVLFGFSAPLVISSCMTTILAVAPPKHRGSASGVANATRQLGASLGVAIIGSILTSIYLSDFRQQLPPVLQAAHVTPQELIKFLSGNLDFHQFYAGILPQTIIKLHVAAKAAYTKGFSVGMIISACLALVGLWFARKLPNKI